MDSLTPFRMPRRGRLKERLTLFGFVLLYVALVVAGRCALLQAETVFGITLFMIASGVLFGVFVFACASYTGTCTKLCECFRFGCSLLLSLALTLFIYVAGRVASEAAGHYFPPNLNLILQAIIIAFVSFFVVTVILLPILAPLDLRHESDSCPELPRTDPFAVLSGRDQPPTYAESQLRNLVGASCSSLPLPGCPPPSYEESQMLKSVRRPLSDPTVTWSEDDSPEAEPSFDGLFPPPYQESRPKRISVNSLVVESAERHPCGCPHAEVISPPPYS